ncbi:ATP-dependent helicase HrpB [Rosistilla oblonga]|uniref:ATP-dependent helicase HrpB n=1 Tax=Rosistilla oblonga TaxID=2527990 RepID=UPI003A96ECD7
MPIADCIDAITAALARKRSVVLKAPPGAGKTTGVPLALLGSDASASTAGQSGRILLVQPRRLAARSAAARLATLRHSKLGNEVGYHVRFDRQVGSETRLIAMTTGMLLRRLQDDPLLEDVGCVILDEFHERSLDGDLALGMLCRIRRTLRDDLRLVIMSATLQPEPIVEFLGDAEAIESRGRSFHVAISHAGDLSTDRIENQVVAALPEMLSSTAGHILVFLPGVGEIRRTQHAIEAAGLAGDCQVMQLYGDLRPDQQDRVIAASGQRKVILSTNVAETSVTIPGVTGVIDSGLARVLRYDDRVGLPRLQIENISQASATQRAGRAGRTEPGVCRRLWSETLQRTRPPADSPEILRADFSGAALTLAAWGERDATDFPWLTPPRSDSVDRAYRLLELLGAVDADRAVTSMGKQMAAQPLSPRLARFLVEADQLGIADDAALAAALLTERSPFDRDSLPSGADVGSCDVALRVQMLKDLRDGNANVRVHPGAVKTIWKVADRLAGRRQKSSPRQQLSDGATVAADLLARALLAAFPDRVARRRSPGSAQGVMVGGRGVRLHRGSVACHVATAQADRAELFLCLDVEASGSEAQVRMATQIDARCLDDDQVRRVDQPRFDPQSQAVQMRRCLYFSDLLLSEAPIACAPSPETAQLLYDEAARDHARVFPPDKPEVAGLIHRVAFLNNHAPDLELPPLDDDRINQVLRELCQSRTSFAQLRSAPWLDHLLGSFDYQQQHAIERHAPARMQVPSGNWRTIEYTPDKPPVMQVKLQELFGWTDTPRIAGGRVRLQLHLLGPNQRPQQITDDLANFWRTTYTVVRKELRRRYPKHHWPEDPLSAEATRNGMQQRRPKKE